MKFGTLLSNLAKKAGIDVTQQAFVDLLSHDIEIPDTIASTLEKNLMDINAAKANTEVRKAIRTEALNGVDSKVTELLEELGIEEADDITGEKNSYEKVAKLARKVKELESKKAGADKGDKAAIEKQIADLNNELRTAKAAIQAKESEFAKTRESDLTNFEIQKQLLGKNYSLPTEMDRDLVITTAQSAVNKALASKGFTIVRQDGALKLVNKEGMPAYNDNNEALEVSSYIDGVLAQNKLLKVNDQNPGGGGKNQHTVIPGGGGQTGNQQIVAEIDGQLFK